jgi:hypothetical protein
MPADLLTRSSLLAALAVLGLAVPLWLGPRAALPPPAYFAHDQRHYLAAAKKGTAPFFDQKRGQPVDAPFAWRILPAALVRATGSEPERGFHALTLLTLALLPPAIAIMLLAAGASATSAFALAALSAFAPPAAGYLSWD